MSVGSVPVSPEWHKATHFLDKDNRPEELWRKGQDLAGSVASRRKAGRDEVLRRQQGELQNLKYANKKS